MANSRSIHAYALRCRLMATRKSILMPDPHFLPPGRLLVREFEPAERQAAVVFGERFVGWSEAAG